MKAVVVSSADVLASNRLDSKFHIAATEVKGEVEELKSRMDEEQAMTLAHRLANVLTPDQLREALDPLRRGANPSFSPKTEEVERLIRDYPHLSLALLSKGVEAAEAVYQAAIAQAQGSLAELSDLSQSVSRPRSPR